VKDLNPSPMSFQDIQGGPHPPSRRSQSPAQAVAAGIFQINTAVATFRRLVDAIGTVKDTPEHRQKLYLHFTPFSLHFFFFFFFFFFFLCVFTMVCLVGTIRGRGYCSRWRILLLSSNHFVNLIVMLIPM